MDVEHSHIFVSRWSGRDVISSSQLKEFLEPYCCHQRRTFPKRSSRASGQSIWPYTPYQCQAPPTCKESMGSIGRPGFGWARDGQRLSFGPLHSLVELVLVGLLHAYTFVPAHHKSFFRQGQVSTTLVPFEELLSVSTWPPK